MWEQGVSVTEPWGGGSVGGVPMKVSSKHAECEGETLRRLETRKALHGSQANALGHTLCSAPRGEKTLEAKFSYRPSEFSQRPSEVSLTPSVQLKIPKVQPETPSV